MSNKVDSYRKALRDAKNDFVRASQQSAKRLTKEKARLSTELTRLLARTKRAEKDLQGKVRRLGMLSRSKATKASQELKKKIANLKGSISEGKREAARIRTELKIVKADLSDASHHLSHALHIDRAVTSIDKKLRTTREKLKRRRAMAKQKKSGGDELSGL